MLVLQGAIFKRQVHLRQGHVRAQYVSLHRSLFRKFALSENFNGFL